MKKIFSLILSLALLLSLCACSGSNAESTEAAANNAFMAGFAKVDITPSQLGVPMNGYGNQATRLSTGLGSYIYAIAVAVTDAEGNSAIMMAVDSCGVDEKICDEVRMWAEKTYSIPVPNIFISALHQHSSPQSTADNYRSELVKGLKTAITQALDDRAPTEVYINRVETEALSFIRRVWANDGTFFTSHSGSLESGFNRYENDPDKEMRMVKFTREEKKDIIVVNFQGHPHMGTSSSQTEIHSDWPGAMRDEVSKKLDANCIYFSGAGGNMNSTCYVNAHNVTQPKTDFVAHGKRAAQYVIKAEDSYTKVNTGLIACKEISHDYPADHSLDYLLPQASIISRAYNNEGREAAVALLADYPEINSWFQANAVVSKASRGATVEGSLSVITFGDIAFTSHPYETFDINGKQVREGTIGNPNFDEADQLANPFAMTIITTISNGSKGYLPSAEGYRNGGYEPDTTSYAAGTGETMVTEFLQMLNELYAG